MKLTKRALKKLIKEAMDDYGGQDDTELADELVTLAVRERMKSAMQYDDLLYMDMGLLEMAKAQESVENWSAGKEDDLYWLDFCYEELENHPAAGKLAKFGSYNTRRARGIGKGSYYDT